MWPVAIVRIALGYNYFTLVISRLQAGYLQHAYISERLRISDTDTSAGGLYFELFKTLVQSQWLLCTYVLIVFELLIATSYVSGFAVRIASLLGMILSMHIYFYFDFQTSPGQIYLFYVHFLFCLLGAGRCLGLDYYFFKSRRGLLW